jgi:cytochrome c
MKRRAMRYIYGVLLLGLLTGCTDNEAKQPLLNGKLLLEQKCAKCHNLDMPPKSYENEIAPSMMAVTFHLKDFITSNNPSEHEGKVVTFIKDYVVAPSREKSYCDKESLDSYGVMPSQKGNVTQEELDAIAHHMYATYDNQQMLKVMAENQRLESLSLHERVLEQQRCQNCHDIYKDKVAPSFEMIANRYGSKDKEELVKSIKEGSKGKWEGKKLPMIPFKKMSDQDIEGMVDWILSLKK